MTTSRDEVSIDELSRIVGLPRHLDARRLLGRGGTGFVLEAFDLRTSQRVAIKVLHGDGASHKARWLARREIRAALLLRHPRIVPVIDAGHTAEGRPFLVMPFVEGPTLTRFAAMLPPWAELRQVLDDVLAALAYAHARGVVHRDLKPDNVLVPGAGVTQARGALLDFGVARIAGQHGEAHGRVGTPAIMAPEQIRGDDAEIGRGTDLYAFGVLLHIVCGGQPPFPGDDPEQTMRRHLVEPAPRLVTFAEYARVDGLADLAEWLLAKDSADRPRFAADVRVVLASMSDRASTPTGMRVVQRPTRGGSVMPGGIVSAVPAPQRGGASGTWPQVAFGGSLVTLTTNADGVPTPASPPGGTPPWGAGVSPGLLADLLSIRRGSDEPPPVERQRELESPLELAAGEPPYVGRAHEREVLADAARAVLRGSGARVVIVEGAAGSGKSRLLGSTLRRLEEEGTHAGLLATCSATTGSREAVLRAVSRTVGCLGADHGATLARVARFLRAHGGIRDPGSVSRLATVLYGAVGTDRAAPLLEEFSVIADALARLAHDRALALAIDDAHASIGLTALRFVQWLLERQAIVSDPILVTVSVRSEAIAERPGLAALLDELGARVGVTRLRLDPLDAEHSRAVARVFLRTRPELREEVCARAEGNPLLLVELSKCAEATGRVPADAGSGLWLRLLDDAVAPEPRGADVARIARIAAMDGLEVHVSLLADVVGRASSELVERARDVLTSRGVWIDTDDADVVRFAHRPMHQAANEAGDHLHDAADLHRRWADLWTVRGDRIRGEVDVRVARHLQRAGDFADAAGLWASVARRMEDRGQWDSANAAAERADALFAQVGLAPTDPARVELLIIRAGVASRRNQMNEAERIFQRVAELARARSETELLSRALAGLAEVARHGGRLTEAKQLLLESVGLVESARLYSGATVRSCMLAAGLARRLGEMDLAADLYARTQRHAAAVTETAGRAQALLGLALLDTYFESWGGAAARAQEARAIATASGLPGIAAHAENVLGECARQRGDLGEARGAYLEALDLAGVAGDLTIASMAVHNLVIVALALGDDGAAEGLLERLRRMLASGASVAMRGHVTLARAILSVRRGRNDEAWARVEELASVVASEPDTAVLLGMLRDSARSAGDELMATHAQRLLTRRTTAPPMRRPQGTG
ncbi:MAG: protein kinase [Deltaproteobacteria bacterium]|nr:protein kinase [Deltaproteobacteria bacterium]